MLKALATRVAILAAARTSPSSRPSWTMSRARTTSTAAASMPLGYPTAAAGRSPSPARPRRPSPPSPASPQPPTPRSSTAATGRSPPCSSTAPRISRRRIIRTAATATAALFATRGAWQRIGQRNGCNTSGAAVRTGAGDGYESFNYSGCRDETTLYRVGGGTHTWYPSTPNASREVWQFFQRH